MKKYFIILLIFGLLFTGTETFARSRIRGPRGYSGGGVAEPSGFEGEGMFVELPAQTGNFVMSGIGTFVIYPILFYVQGLSGGFSSDKSWAFAKSIATPTFGYFGYYTFGTPCWLIKTIIWDIPTFCLGLFF